MMVDNKNNMIKAIFFDLCGVIITLGDKEFCDELSKRINIKSKKILDVFYKYLGENETGKITEEEFYKKMYDELEVSFDSEETKNIRTSFRIEVPRMREFVTKLKKTYLVGYISNDAKEMARRCDQKFKLNELFNTGFLAYQVGARKDSLKLFLSILEQVNLRPQECVFLDDKEKNLIEARKLGFKTIVFKNKDQLVNELVSIGVKIESRTREFC